MTGRRPARFREADAAAEQAAERERATAAGCAARANEREARERRERAYLAARERRERKLERRAARDREIMRLHADGRSTLEIAAALGCGCKTVERAIRRRESGE